MDYAESSDTTRIAFESVGAEAPEADDLVIVLPGGPSRDPIYLDDLAGLGTGYPYVVVHFRGTPETGGLSRGWWTDAEDVIAVMDHVGASSAKIVAHSAGTRVALALAHRFANRVRSLALITPAAAWLTGTQHDGHLVAAQRTEPEVLEALKSTEIEPTDEASFHEALRAEAPLGYGAWTEVEKEHAARGGMSLAGAQAWFSEIPSDVAAKIVQTALPPTMVLSGERDILSGIEPVRAYAAALGAELRSIDGCGHYPWVEKPKVFLSELERWLAKSN